MVAKPKRIKSSRADAVFNVICYVLLSFILIITGYPLIYVLSASLSTPYAVTSGQVWLLPVDFSTLGYETVFKDTTLVRGFFNSVFVTAAGTCLNIVLTILAAYPLSLKDFHGRNILMGIFAFTMFFGGGLIPSYLLIDSLGMNNTYWAIILPGAVGVYNVVVARTFFQSTIPAELHEAAELDGCSDFLFLIKVVVPLSAPIIAVLTMYYAVGHWNSYFGPMIYLSDKNLFTFQVILRNILIRNQTAEMMTDVNVMLQRQGLTNLMKYSLIVISSVPMLALYPFIQKHFVKGVMVGALKG